MKVKSIDIEYAVSKKLNREVISNISIDMYHGDRELPSGTALHSLTTAIGNLGSKDSRKALLEYYWNLSKVIDDIKNTQAEVIEKLTRYDKGKKR